MAQYPAGTYNNRSSKIRLLMYVGVVVVVAVVVIAVVMLLRGRKSEPVTADLPPAIIEPAAETATAPAPVVSNEAPAAVENTKPIEIVEPKAEPAAAQAAVAPAVAAESSQDVNQLIAQAMTLLNQPGGVKIAEARDRLNELLPIAQGQQRAFIKDQLARLSEQWLFSKVVLPMDKLCTNYKVSPGDSLTNIGRHYNVPYEILMQINGIDRPELLQAGTTIKVINGPFHARVSRSAYTMDVYLQNTYVKSFPVGLGKPGQETPTGRWRAAEGGKLEKPRWTDPDTGRTYEPEDPDYPLGSRWIGLEGLEGAAVGRTGFAIHGTKDPHQIGTPGSRGCIRLHNGDAILVYNLMMPGVSLVDVVD